MKEPLTTGSAGAISSNRYLVAAPYIVLALTLTVTLIFWYLYDASLKNRALHVYNERTDDISSRIIGRMHSNEQILRGGAGLFNTNNEVSREQWRRYVSTLKLEENYPGIQGVGFSKWITPDKKEEHISSIRKEGFPEYSIRPEGERPAYTSVIYLEPFDWRNQRAFGYDMFTETVRRNAMEKAIESGETSIAARITLVQETDRDKQNGMLMYLPVYRQGMPVDSVEKRRSAIFGFVYSPIRVKDFVYATLGSTPEDIAFEFYAADTEQSDALMFSSVAAGKPTLPHDYQPLHQNRKIFEAYGRKWLITFKTLPPFTVELNRSASSAVLTGGILISLLLTQIVFMINAARRREFEAARSIAESESHFRSYYELGLIGMAITSMEKGWVQYNDRLCSMLGYSREELSSISWDQMTHPDDLAADEAQFNRVLRGEIDGYSMDKRFIRKDGLTVQTAISVKCLRKQDGSPKHFVAMVQDIGERKQLQDALQRHIITLTQPLDDSSDIQFSDLFDLGELQQIQDAFAEATGVASIITTTEGIPVTRPSNFCRLCSDIIRKSEKGLANCIKSDMELGRCNPTGPIVQPCMSGGLWDGGASITVGGRHVANWLIGQVRNEAQDEAEMLEYADKIGVDRELFRGALAEVPTMSKERFDKVALALFLLANELSLKAYQNILQARFIAERKRYVTDLQQKNAELERFTYTVSHDLKSPIITIKGFTGTLEKDLKLGRYERMEGDLKRVSDAADKMNDLLHDLLQLSTIGRVVKAQEQVDMNLLADDVLAQLDGPLKNRNLTVEVQQGLPSLFCDRQRMAEVLQNLIENSINYMGEQAAPQIRFGAREEDGENIFFVQDNGIGIDEKYHLIIFGLFNKLDTKSGGTGVGLALVKRIIEVHEGRVWVESEGVGMGSRFCFTIKERNNER